MRYIFFLFIFCFRCAIVFAQQTDDAVFLCQDTVHIISINNADSLSTIYFINVHEDESTGIKAVKDFLQNNHGVFSYLHHKQTRNISFNCDGNTYTFDPNRIYSDSGRMATLKKLSQYNLRADSLVKYFAMQVLKKLDSAKHIVALHNNTDENYSIKSYLQGGSEAGNAAKIYINKKNDADDFVFTTDEKIFKACKKLKLNVALQDNEHCKDDGSLSVYFGKLHISYTNIEAQHGHLEMQEELVEKIWEMNN